MNRNQLRGPTLVLAMALSMGTIAADAKADTAGRATLEKQFPGQTEADVTVALRIGRAGEIKMFLNPDDPMVTKRLVEERTWEPNETHWFLKTVKQGDVVVDVGANVGYYTLIAGKLVGDSGKVYAFEPDPVAFGLLQRNVALNGLNNVVLEQKAVSNKAGSIRLFLSEENKGDHRIFESGEERRSIPIEAVALDDYFQGDTRKIDFVKVDTQGAEAAIIDGMEQLIRENEQITLVVEFWPHALKQFGRDSDEFLAKLESFAFHFFSLGIWGSPSPLRLVEPAELSAKLTVENERFTNLLLTRQLPGKNRRKPN